jgi:predicted O-methyltransferase YrrM
MRLHKEAMTTTQIAQMLCDLSSGKNYVEIGIYRGVLFAEVAKVAKTATGIDNFSLFDAQGTNHAAALERIKDIPTAKIYNQDCYDSTVRARFKKNSIDVLMYDACHTFIETLNALELYEPKVKRNGAIVVDDYNDAPVRAAVKQFCDNVEGWRVVEVRETPKNASDDWWNGIAVLRCEK